MQCRKFILRNFAYSLCFVIRTRTFVFRAFRTLFVFRIPDLVGIILSLVV
jgi:hypothetical protein